MRSPPTAGSTRHPRAEPPTTGPWPRSGTGNDPSRSIAARSRCESARTTTIRRRTHAVVLSTPTATSRSARIGDTDHDERSDAIDRRMSEMRIRRSRWLSTRARRRSADRGVLGLAMPTTTIGPVHERGHVAVIRSALRRRRSLRRSDARASSCAARRRAAADRDAASARGGDTRASLSRGPRLPRHRATCGRR